MEWIIYIVVALVVLDKLRSITLRLGILELHFGFGEGRFLKTETKPESDEKLLKD
ncbi:MAG: hypothetical protein LC794_04575 [Acidobacteria bacterium]|nr:hypothetical protein [Acidobacteriota bacterium]